MRECPPVPAHPSWARESDESGEDGTGDYLSAAYAALRRLRRREGEAGERAEAGGLWCSCVEVRGFSPTRMRLRFSSPSECGDIPVVQQRRLRTVQPVKKTCDSTVLVQLWELSFSRRRLGEEGGSSSFRLGVGAHHTGDEPM